ncbi:hypothetical protein HW130_01115 [Streptomyces sp. PKU-EA00015]|uniref:hypothetical protein n=1 Tax=Streptomyces sp. PKU-EA00015 TaxID=2748326 RepID=UPI0015A3D032|nr:hypothetical protein [Streptomyces sp. PKU-EA00015]NWF24873.1 hypothetical protein [Streptomyces sp. PKU-EA00015]
MDYGKLDVSLAAAVDTSSGDPDARNLLVTVHLHGVPTAAQRGVLRDTGVEAPSPDRTVATGTVSRRGVENLSHEPWVRSLSLSSTRRPLAGDP